MKQYRHSQSDSYMFETVISEDGKEEYYALFTDAEGTDRRVQISAEVYAEMQSGARHEAAQRKQVRRYHVSRLVFSG